MENLKDSFGLSEFVREMTDIVENECDQFNLVTKAEQLVGKLVSNSSWFPFNKVAPNQNHYGRYSLYVDPKNRFEVLALIWAPGQETPLHDHDGTWGVEGVLAGRMKVTNYMQTGKVSDEIVNLCYSGAMTIGKQSTGQLLPPADCHILKAGEEQITITIHVYGKQLNQFKIFEALNEEGTYKSYYKPVGYTAKIS